MLLASQKGVVQADEDSDGVRQNCAQKGAQSGHQNEGSAGNSRIDAAFHQVRFEVFLLGEEEVDETGSNADDDRGDHLAAQRADQLLPGRGVDQLENDAGDGCEQESRVENFFRLLKGCYCQILGKHMHIGHERTSVKKGTC